MNGQGQQRNGICHGLTRKREANKPKEIHLPRTNTELHGIRREIRAGSVSDGRQREAFATDEHGKEEKQKKHLPRMNTEIKKSKEEAFVTELHGKRIIRHSHREDAKSAK